MWPLVVLLVWYAFVILMACVSGVESVKPDPFFDEQLWKCDADPFVIKPSRQKSRFFQDEEAAGPVRPFDFKLGKTASWKVTRPPGRTNDCERFDRELRGLRPGTATANASVTSVSSPIKKYSEKIIRPPKKKVDEQPVEIETIDKIPWTLFITTENKSTKKLSWCTLKNVYVLKSVDDLTGSLEHNGGVYQFAAKKDDGQMTILYTGMSTHVGRRMKTYIGSGSHLQKKTAPVFESEIYHWKSIYVRIQSLPPGQEERYEDKLLRSANYPWNHMKNNGRDSDVIQRAQALYHQKSPRAMTHQGPSSAVSTSATGSEVRHRHVEVTRTPTKAPPKQQGKKQCMGYARSKKRQCSLPAKDGSNYCHWHEPRQMVTITKPKQKQK